MNPKVSIIIPTHICAYLLPRAISSVLNQKLYKERLFLKITIFKNI